MLKSVSEVFPIGNSLDAAPHVRGTEQRAGTTQKR